MKNIKKEVNESILLMNDFNYDKKHDIYMNYDKMMALGGDNFQGVCDTLQVSGNSALVVNGSGDQALELGYRDFTHIDTFDINLLSRHMLNLKMAAIAALNYTEFVLFSKMLFKNKELYLKIRPFLKEETLHYFELLFSQKSEYEVYNNLFTHKFALINQTIWDYTKQNFSFYNESAFYILKDKICHNNLNINFHHMDLVKPLAFALKYDVIYFSNILYFTNKNISTFIKDILPVYLNCLQKDGLLIVFYMHFFEGKLNSFLNGNDCFITHNYYNQVSHDINQNIYNELKDLADVECRIPASGFGHGLSENDFVLAMRKK